MADHSVAEEWRPAIGFKGAYSVSNIGRVRSERTGQIIKPIRRASGHLRMFLWNSGIKRSRSVHGMVLEAFVVNRPLVIGEMPDHINGIRDDNRQENLRVANAKENTWNRRCTNSFGFKGIRLTVSGRFEARIRPHGTEQFLGTFDTAEDAARAYDAAALKHYGEFARFNFPEGIRHVA